VKDKVSYVVPEAIKDKGTDASNIYDEELPVEEQGFSDDEMEMNAKKNANKGRRARDTSKITGDSSSSLIRSDESVMSADTKKSFNHHSKTSSYSALRAPSGHFATPQNSFSYHGSNSYPTPQYTPTPYYYPPQFPTAMPPHAEYGGYTYQPPPPAYQVPRFYSNQGINNMPMSHHPPPMHTHVPYSHNPTTHPIAKIHAEVLKDPEEKTLRVNYLIIWTIYIYIYIHTYIYMFISYMYKYVSLMYISILF
jgi:H/ACA ribonucleoprotein complex non-core subunit NAF1